MTSCDWAAHSATWSVMPPQRIVEDLLPTATRLAATLRKFTISSNSFISPVAPRMSQSVLSACGGGTNSAKHYAPPKRCLALLDLISPAVPVLPLLRSYFTTQSQLRNSVPLSSLHNETGTINVVHRPGALRSYLTTCDRPSLHCFLPVPLFRSGPRRSAYSGSPPSGKMACGPRIRAKSSVSLQTESGSCGLQQSCFPLHGQNRSSLCSSRDYPLRPFNSYVATQPNTGDPSGKRRLLRPFTLTQ